MKKSSKKSGFTLVELLVVITIIAILASLAIPGVNLALDKANQLKDVANAKQLGTILFTAANDNNGLYPTLNASGAAASDSVGIFEGLVADQYLTNASVLATTKCSAYKGTLESDQISGKLAGTQPRYVGWAYTLGLDTSSDGRFPLLITHGAFTNLTSMQSDDGAVAIDDANNLWTDKGVAILYLGQNAEFVKARNKQIGRVNEPVFPGSITIPTGVQLLEASTGS
ncbi:MAG: type II secretion system protein [Verrucomicrobiota bacterium]